MAQPWSDSVSSQELYAPETLARRLARARTMRFGFTPYNSAPVVAEFDVSGFDQLVGLVAARAAGASTIPAPRKSAEQRSTEREPSQTRPAFPFPPC